VLQVARLGEVLGPVAEEELVLVPLAEVVLDRGDRGLEGGDELVVGDEAPEAPLPRDGLPAAPISLTALSKPSSVPDSFTSFPKVPFPPSTFSRMEVRESAARSALSATDWIEAMMGLSSARVSPTAPRRSPAVLEISPEMSCTRWSRAAENARRLAIVCRSSSRLSATTDRASLASSPMCVTAVLIPCGSRRACVETAEGAVKFSEL
jgi:hypothetical protein